MNAIVQARLSSISRREFLQYAAMTGAATALPALALANGEADARFVLVILRGALDGLAAVPAYGDSHYARQRGALAIASLDHKLNDLFALSPALPHCYERYQAKELIVFHAVATSYRERAHFEGQELLENGAVTSASARDGWLNRMLPTLPVARARGTEQIAVALTQNIPLVLRGQARVNFPAPSPFADAQCNAMQGIANSCAANVYRVDHLEAALASSGIVAESAQVSGRDPSVQFDAQAAAVGKLLAADTGPRVAVIEVGGWDTHSDQGAESGQLADRLHGLDQSLETLRMSLGPAWSKTAILVTTEFGRTVTMNGTRGTDHGTATCAFLLGGAVAGGRVIADWPGLASRELYQGEDLRPTLDLRSVFKGVAAAHLQSSESDLEARVFPDSRCAHPLEGLIRMA